MTEITPKQNVLSANPVPPEPDLNLAAETEDVPPNYPKAVAEFRDTARSRAAAYAQAARTLGTSHRWLIAMGAVLSGVTSIAVLASVIPRPVVAGISALGGLLLIAASKFGSDKRANRFATAAYAFNDLDGQASDLILRLRELSEDRKSKELQQLRAAERNALAILNNDVVPASAIRKAKEKLDTFSAVQFFHSLWK